MKKNKTENTALNVKLTKTIIYDYLNSMRDKALTAIAQQNADKKAAYIEKFFAKSKYLSMVNDVIAIGAKLNEVVDLLQEAINDKFNYYFWSNYRVNMSEASLKERIIVQLNDEGYINLLNANKTRVRQTENAYSDIKNIVKEMQSIPKILEYLKTLGFKQDDIKKYAVDNAVRIETEFTSKKKQKEVLFPCLDNSEKAS